MREEEHFKEIDEYFDGLSADEFLEVAKRNGFNEITNFNNESKTQTEQLKEVKKILEETIVRVIDNSASIIYDVRNKINQIESMIKESYEKEKNNGQNEE